MQINLNDSNDFTLENVRALIASGTDDTPSQIRVSKDGMAFLSKTIGNIDTDDLAFRLETYMAGNGYVGAEAAKDAGFITRIYECLKENWPNPSSTYIDYY